MFINLDRRPDRRRAMEALAAPHRWLHTAMERLPAVDGRALSWRQLLDEGLFSQEAFDASQQAEREKRATIGPTPSLCSPHLTLGGCGCALSHRRAWQSLVNSSSRWALLLEDDLSQICDRFDEELQRVLGALPFGWELCYLGFHTGRLLPRGRRFTGPLVRLGDEGTWLAGLWGYLISRAGAQRLLELALPMGAQVDTVVGCLVADGAHGYAVPDGQFLLFSPPTERTKDTDVQTFPKDMR